MDTIAVPIDVLVGAGSFVVGWFLGGWYKSRRNEGMSKAQVTDLAQEELAKEYQAAVAKVKEIAARIKA